jgi:hypothetical protein
MKSLLFDQPNDPNKDPLRPSETRRATALIESLTTILWTASQEGQRSVVILLPKGGPQKQHTKFIPNQIQYYNFSDIKGVKEFIATNLAHVRILTFELFNKFSSHFLKGTESYTFCILYY